MTWETGDIADLARLREIVRRHDIRSIINLAGLQVPFCKANPPLGARVNVEGTINVLETARDRNIRRLAYASSVAALGMPPGGAYLSTLYGAYKLANEYTAKVYSMDWGVPSVGLRPNVVYGVGRDQGMSSSFTVGIACAVQGDTHDIPYTGALIPTVIDQNPCAHLRMPRDMIFHGWSMRLFQAWQHSATMSS